MFNLDKKGSPEPSLDGECTCPKFKAAKNRLLLLLGANTSEVLAKYSAGALITNSYGFFSFSVTVGFEYSAFKLIFP